MTVSFLFFSLGFLAFLFCRFIILQFDHVRSSLTIYTAAVFIYYSPASLAVHFIASLFPSLPSLARSFASFCFSYISHIFWSVVSQINYMRCFMRRHNSISCTFFVFSLFFVFYFRNGIYFKHSWHNNFSIVCCRLFVCVCVRRNWTELTWTWLWL